MRFEAASAVSASASRLSTAIEVFCVSDKAAIFLGAVVADQPQGETEQDRCEGRQSRSLRDIPDGRSRVSATDVRGHPVADRPAADTARRHDGRGEQMRQTNEGRNMPRYGQSGARQRFGAVKSPASIASCSRWARCALAKIGQRAILAHNRRKSGECRISALVPGSVRRRQKNGCARRPFEPKR
jgi:hypothetical protein